MTLKYFSGEVLRDARMFIGRQPESKKLLANIKNHIPTIIVSPRRYGRSSFVGHVAEKAKMQFAELACAGLFSDGALRDRLMVIIQDVAEGYQDVSKEHFVAVQDFCASNTNGWVCSYASGKLRIAAGGGDSFIADGCVVLNYILDLFGDSLILEIDEMQGLQASGFGVHLMDDLLGRLSETKRIYPVISSSSSLFLRLDDSSIASEYLAACDRLALGRIDSAAYKAYLNQVARVCWHEDLHDELFYSIAAITEYHPYAVSLLSQAIWAASPARQPVKSTATKCWQDIVARYRKDIVQRLRGLSAGQLQLLVAIASGINSQLTGKAVQRRLDLTSGALVYALRGLEQSYYIEKVGGGAYRIIDPLVRAVLLA
ncbi:MAG: hypothetical protein KAS93_05725 [Gammaproteobacteria bacterium]|nr:hypothetical protein [Gammaproteobacteria bacterium]